MDKKVVLAEIRAIAEEYVKEHLPDEHPFFNIIWTDIEHPLDTLSKPPPVLKPTVWYGGHAKTGFGFDGNQKATAWTPAIILSAEAMTLELNASVGVPSLEQVKKGLVSFAVAYGMPKKKAQQLGDGIAAKLQRRISALLTGTPEPGTTPSDDATPIPLEVSNHPYVFRRYKDAWWVSFGQERGWVRHEIGMSYLNFLLHNPRKLYSPQDLRLDAGEILPADSPCAEQFDKMSNDELAKLHLTKTRGLSTAKEDPSSVPRIREILRALSREIQLAEQSKTGDEDRLDLLMQLSKEYHNELDNVASGHIADEDEVRARKAVDIALARAQRSIKKRGYPNLYAHLRVNIRTEGGDKMYLASDNAVVWLS